MEAVDAVFGYAAVMSALANAVMPLFDDSTDGEAGSPIMAGEKASMTTWFWRWRWHVGTASNSGSFSITNSEPK